jgi:hypothetical protein
MTGRSRLAYAAVAFALAAALSSWNPLAAPFGLVVGVAAIAISTRALRSGGRRVLAGIALVVALGAVAASGLVLAISAGVGRELAGGAVVDAPAAADAEKQLDAAAARTREARERARAELREVDGGGGK